MLHARPCERSSNGQPGSWASPGRASRPSAACPISARPVHPGRVTARSTSSRSFEPGHPRRGMASEVHHGRPLCGREARPRPPRFGGLGGQRQDVGRRDAEHRRPAPGPGPRPEHVVELHGNGTYATCLACGRATNSRPCGPSSTRPARRPSVPAAVPSSRRPSRSGSRCRGRDAARAGRHARLRSRPSYRVVAGRAPGRGVAPDGQGQRRAAGHSQPRTDPAGRPCRPGDPGRHRRRAGALSAPTRERAPSSRISAAV